MADKTDFKKTLDAYKAQRNRFRIVDVPDMQYLQVDGEGDPNSSPAFTAAIETLFPVAYTLKFASKRLLDRDYVVPPLEGLWWSQDMASFSIARDKSLWSWTLLSMVPDWIDAAMVAEAVESARAKSSPPRIDDLRFETLSEGRCVQTLHVGSFDDEAGVLERMHREFIPQHDLEMTGRHHEIYLSDIRRSDPDKQRVILRQPVVHVAR